MERWTDEEVQYLINNYQTKTQKELAKELGRTKKGLCQKVKTLKLRKRQRIKKQLDWTPEMDKWIWEHKEMGYRQMVKHFGATQLDMQHHRADLGVNFRGHIWTPEEDAYLFDHKNDFIQDVADALGLTYNIVCKRRVKLGVEKDERGDLPDGLKERIKAENEQILRERAEALNGIKQKIDIGRCFEMQNKKYKVIEKYPHFVRAKNLESKQARTECFLYVDLRRIA